MIGGPILAIGIFWLGWTRVYVPALTIIFLGARIGLMFFGALTAHYPTIFYLQS